MSPRLCRRLVHTATLAVVFWSAQPGYVCAEQPAQIRSSPVAKKPIVNTNKALFDLVATLAAKRPFRVSSLTEILGLPLKEDRSASNPYFSVFQSARRAEGLVLEAELRESRGVATEGPVDGFLHLEINPRPCIDEDTIQKQFGANPEFTVPSAHGSPKTPTYLRYRQDWGRLSFGFSQGKQSCLVRIIFDAIKP